MTRQALRRIAVMQPGELRFRGLCELRKLGGRIRTGLSRPAWQRAALAGALSRSHPSSSLTAIRSSLERGDHASAHRELATHFAGRPSAFPSSARSVPQVASDVKARFPGAAKEAVRLADSVVEGRYDLLAYRALPLGRSPDWHADVVHGRRSPEDYWATVPFLDPAAGDHKVIWELNRHQHWLLLARAHALSGDRTYYDLFTSQLSGWLVANPPLIGTNWASMLEVAIRTISWLWALELFARQAGAGDPEPWLVDMLLALDRQLTHVEHNLSHYFSPNTHLSGEALALYVAGTALPELRASARRMAIGRDVLIQEAARQVRADGGHAELSTHYHRYSTDFYLLAAAVAKRSQDPAAAIFEEAARLQARYLRTICDDEGRRPQIGDDDGGQLFPICGRPADDCRGTLATAAVLLEEQALGIGPVAEEAFWMCGAEAATATADRAQWASAGLPSSGYYVSRTASGDHLMFDAGPHGFLNGGHAHADALSCTLAVAGRPLLIDPGTATYTMDDELRNRFRSTMMHNTVVLDGRSQSEPRGPFHWSSMTSADAPIWRCASGCDYVEGTHHGYAPRRHTRAILAIHGMGWWVLDHILGEPAAAAAETYWHLHPAWDPELGHPNVCRLQNGAVALALASTAPLTVLGAGEHPLATYSPVYGATEPAPVLRGSVRLAPPATVATFIAAVPELAAQLRIEELAVSCSPGGDWHGTAFRVRWSRGAMILLAAIEKTGVALPDTAAPATRWGTAELQTDARLAALIDHSPGRSEAILVNGAQVNAYPAHTLVSLSRRVPLLRLASAALAPRMHEVGA